MSENENTEISSAAPEIQQPKAEQPKAEQPKAKTDLPKRQAPPPPRDPPPREFSKIAECSGSITKSEAITIAADLEQALSAYVAVAPENMKRRLRLRVKLAAKLKSYVGGL